MLVNGYNWHTRINMSYHTLTNYLSHKFSTLNKITGIVNVKKYTAPEKINP